MHPKFNCRIWPYIGRPHLHIHRRHTSLHGGRFAYLVDGAMWCKSARSLFLFDRRLQLFSRTVWRDLRARDLVKPEVVEVAGAIFGLVGGSNRIDGKVFRTVKLQEAKKEEPGVFPVRLVIGKEDRREDARRPVATSGTAEKKISSYWCSRFFLVWTEKTKQRKSRSDLLGSGKIILCGTRVVITGGY
ncbi:hypothetical protein U1Q18_016461 [Sarracenia purpurea var. burkii]